MHLGAGGSSKNNRTWARVYCFCVSKRMQFHAVSLLTLFPLNKDNFFHLHSKPHDKSRGEQGFKRMFSSVSLEYASGLCSGCARLCTFHKLHLRSGLPSKVIHLKYYKNLKKSCSAQPFGQAKNGLVSGTLACTSSKTEVLNKIGIKLI